MGDAIYTMVEHFRIQAECTAPLHVGDAGGDREAVLVHPVKQVPFIQATSLCGVMRAYYEETHKKMETETLFGRADAGSGSRIKFSDGFFEEDTLQMEIRPRVAINDETGTADDSAVKGSNVRSGNKFEMECVGTGSRFHYDMVVLSNIAYKDEIVACIQAMNLGDIQIGAVKSSGFGYIKIISALYDSYDMTDPVQRENWMKQQIKHSENTIPDDAAHRINLQGQGKSHRAYHIVLSGVTDGELLVKDIAPEDYGEGEADVVNIKNGRREFIIPGTSLKGVLRSRMEQIADYMEVSDTVIADAFGSASDEQQRGHIGNLRVYDTVIVSKNPKGKGANGAAAVETPLRTRIHIDKFTGGVMNQALFTEKNVAGAVEMHLAITDDPMGYDYPNGKNADRTLGLLLFALRDLASKSYQIGSGYSVGKGYIDVKTVEVTAKDGGKLLLDFGDKAKGRKPRMTDENGLFRRCMEALRA